MSVHEVIGKLASGVMDVGLRSSEFGQRLAEANLEAAQSVLHRNILLGAVCCELVAVHIRGLRQLRTVTDFFQLQREVGEAVNAQLLDYVESLRAIGIDAQERYSAIGRDIAGGLGLKVA